MFKKILIANRGEIAVRVARTCKRLGITSVAIYSFADRHALHTKVADEAYLVGPAESSASYLNVEAIIKLAEKAGVDAVHPGYGFLSENAPFAAALKQAGIIFIGPSPEVISLMGDKLAAKEAAKKAEVPLVPGASLSGKNSLKEAKTFIKENGFPALIKAAAGGGGRGMRKIYNDSKLAEQIEGATREAKAFFNNGDLFIEKLVENARHVEVQIIADGKTAIALGDRDCSMQRNHQKVIEEAPASNISDKTRKSMHELSEALAVTSGYEGAGTVEFLLDKDENFYFLEVNSRLQVEHPVTEEVFGLDLVELQIKVAQGEKLKDLLDRERLEPEGHAIELRICAENPAQNFAASTGKLIAFTPPILEDIKLRFDTGFTTGDSVSHHYDSMLAKLIIHADSRKEAIANTLTALALLRAAGVETNVSFLKRLLNDDAFINCKHHTQYAENLIPNQVDLDFEHTLASTLVLLWDSITFPLSDSHKNLGWSLGSSSKVSAWLKASKTYFNVSLEFPDKTSVKASIRKHPEDNPNILYLRNVFSDENTMYLQTQERDISYVVYRKNNDRWLHSTDGIYKLSLEAPPLKSADATSSGVSKEITSPLPGKIVSIKAPVGTEVEAGAAVIIIESMKMEHILTAALSGKIDEVMVQEGDIIEANAILARIL
ncbi:MAG: biotin carboxylase N-terminal domain-containing protein [Bdellovibrionota bacterium]